MRIYFQPCNLEAFNRRGQGVIGCAKPVLCSRARAASQDGSIRPWACSAVHAVLSFISCARLLIQMSPTGRHKAVLTHHLEMGKKQEVLEVKPLMTKCVLSKQCSAILLMSRCGVANHAKVDAVDKAAQGFLQAAYYKRGNTWIYLFCNTKLEIQIQHRCKGRKNAIFLRGNTFQKTKELVWEIILW